MKKTGLQIAAFAALLIACLAEAAPVSAQMPAHLWSKRFGGSDFHPDIGKSIAFDPAGNVIVTGQFRGTANFGGGNLTSAGEEDIFLAKYSPTGTHLWSQRFGSFGIDQGLSVAINASDEILITGRFEYTVNFGGSDLTDSGLGGIFLTKYSPAGAHAWSKAFANPATQVGTSVAFDNTGSILLTGYFSGSLSLGGPILGSTGGFDLLAAKFDASGTHQWSKSSSDQRGNSVTSDLAGNVYVAGLSEPAGQISEQGTLTKYDSGGTLVWIRTPGGGSANAVASDGTSIFVTGGGVSSSELYLTKYNSDGFRVWYEAAPNADAFGYGLAVRASGNILLAALYRTEFNGTDDIYLAEFDPAGTLQWSYQVGDEYLDAANSVAVSNSGRVAMTGYFRGLITLGADHLASAGGTTDGFLAVFSAEPASPSISTISDVPNDQGRSVRIGFSASGGEDVTSSHAVWQYEAYRRIDAPPSLVTNGTLPKDESTGRSLVDGWTQVGVIQAQGLPDYSLDVPTIGDSTLSSGAYDSDFYIRASTTSPFLYYDSTPATGYSLDNLAPGAPANLAYAAQQLSWDPSGAADFDYFTVYGSATNSFGAATLIDYTVTPGMDVSASPYAFYFVTATDFSGNEGSPAGLETPTGVGGTPASYVLSLSNYPNPFNPRTTLRYTVPARGAVTIGIYDARGARVALLADRVERSAGAYAIEWDGRDAGGMGVSSGVYFARIEHDGVSRTRKLLLLK